MRAPRTGGETAFATTPGAKIAAWRLRLGGRRTAEIGIPAKPFQPPPPSPGVTGKRPQVSSAALRKPGPPSAFPLASKCGPPAGFPDEQSKTRHQQAWPHVLAQLDERLSREWSAKSSARALDVNVQNRIARPVKDVFAAIVEPAEMSQYFISRGSGPMKAGKRVEWEFADVGRKFAVDVKEADANRGIVFAWPASGPLTDVTIAFQAQDEEKTLVAIHEESWPMDEEGVRRALGQTRGWTDFLCCLKAHLEHGVNLRRGRIGRDH